MLPPCGWKQHCRHIIKKVEQSKPHTCAFNVKLLRPLWNNTLLAQRTTLDDSDQNQIRSVCRWLDPHWAPNSPWCCHQSVDVCELLESTHVGLPPVYEWVWMGWMFLWSSHGGYTNIVQEPVSMNAYLGNIVAHSYLHLCHCDFWSRMAVITCN